MRLFNLDMHISIIHDVKTLFRELGHYVDSCCMSGHTWVNGEPQLTTEVVTPSNWLHIDQAMCDRFYEVYKDRLAEYDAFVVSYPPAFGLLFERWGKPVIVIACTRYEYPCGSGSTATKERLDWLNRGLVAGQERGQYHLVANNYYDATYCENFCGGQWTVIPSVCSYLSGVTCDGASGKTLIWDRAPDLRGKVDHQSVDRGFNIATKYRRESVARARAVVHLPYNISIMSAFEHFAMGIPMFAPSQKMLMTEPALLGELTFPQSLNGQPPAGWLALADWYRLLPVTTFGSWDDLRDKLDTLDQPSLTRSMKLAHQLRHRRALKQWREMLEKCAS